MAAGNRRVTVKSRSKGGNGSWLPEAWSAAANRRLCVAHRTAIAVQRRTQAIRHALYFLENTNGLREGRLFVRAQGGIVTAGARGAAARTRIMLSKRYARAE